MFETLKGIDLLRELVRFRRWKNRRGREPAEGEKKENILQKRLQKGKVWEEGKGENFNQKE